MSVKFGKLPSKGGSIALRYPDTQRNLGPIKTAEQIAIEAGVARRGKAGQLQYRTEIKPHLIVLCEKQQYLCPYCGCALTATNVTLDHVYPVSRGGSAVDPANLVACCFSCNNEKGDRIIDIEWTPPSQRVVLTEGSKEAAEIVHRITRRAS